MKKETVEVSFFNFAENERDSGNQLPYIFHSGRNGECAFHYGDHQY